MEALVHWVYNSPFWKYFTLIPEDAGDMESEWAMFKAYIVEVAALTSALGPLFISISTDHCVVSAEVSMVHGYVSQHVSVHPC